MPRKKANEATIAPPPVSDASVPAVKKTRKPAAGSAVAVKPTKAAAPRRKTTATPVAEPEATSIANLSEAIELQSELDIRAIEERAYQSWIERGCPMGSPEEDWYRAERELIARVATAGK